VLKHFINVQYVSGMQLAKVYSLNHDIMASFLFNGHPELPTCDPAMSM
jgi:hypothetical protein